MTDTLYLDFKAAEKAERDALDAWSEANYAQPRDAAHCRLLSDIHDLAYERYRGALSALSTALIPRTPVDVCAHCGKVHRVADMAALTSDYTYGRVTEQYSFERDALFCESCREDFEYTYGTEPYDAADDKFESFYDR